MSCPSSIDAAAFTASAVRRVRIWRVASLNAAQWIGRFRGKADEGRKRQKWRSDPKRHFATANCRIAKRLFDHLVGAGERRLRHGV